ncbi:SRPBCC family protein [Devosia sp.]|uniref:SRPBCC family protein n=1 Tax=Devosia sp. TaxID=1871048 RepID=UPI001ACE9C20|nr:SRPBCC family protein [Devosia sp.]MBN9311328.1 SRPBCC family protein [Devosia sp.]
MMPPLTIALPSDREIAVTRQFRAPAELVFDCWTIPALIRRWLGFDDWTYVTCEFDARVGGKWLFVTRSPDGFEMGSGGEVLEITRPGWIKTTELYDQDWTGGQTIVTNRITEHSGITTSVVTVLYPTKEARDGARATPMAEGMEHGFRRLEDLLASLPAG